MRIWHPFDKKPLIHIDSFFTFFIEQFDKDYYFNGEMHDFWECIYVLKGKIWASNDEKVYELNEGDIIFHHPMALHKLSVMSRNGADLLIFSYTMDGELKTFFKEKTFSLNKAQKKILNDALDYMHSKSKDMELPPDFLEYNRLLAPSDNSPIYLQRVTYYIYQLFLSLADSGEISTSISTSETKTFKTAVRYMLSNLHRQPTVAEIAENSNTSISGIKRIFIKYAGMSVHKYFLNLKLNSAAKLLQSGKTVNEVAEKFNFSSQSYFSTTFKREIGKHPSEYKKSYNIVDEKWQ